MKVFLVGTSFVPTYGGPARSVPRLAETLVAHGVDVALWAADQSALTAPFLSQSSSVTQLGGSLGDALAQFGRPDVIHDNGLWRAHNHQVAKWAVREGIPRVVSIRGMLEPWAWKHKWAKKRLAWWLYQHRDLRSAACHHVTAELERQSVEVFGLDVPIKAIPNGVDPRQMDEEPLEIFQPDYKAMRTALFVGRIYPVKGLPMLVEAWAKVRPKGWRMRIVGPDQAGHQREVEALVAERGLSEFFEFSGELENDAKREAFCDAELFILSSHAENFGVAAGEALACGLPVIATQATPWKLLQDEACGWWVPATVDGLAGGLEEATSQSSERLRAMGCGGREVMAREFEWKSVGQRMLALYESLV